MTPAQKAQLKSLIAEYGESLARIDLEKSRMKSIAYRAEASEDNGEKLCLGNHFKTLATAVYRDTVRAVRNDLSEQVDLFDEVRDA